MVSMSTTTDAQGNLHRTEGPGGGQFSNKQNIAPAGQLQAVSFATLASQTPIEIDEYLAEQYYAHGVVLYKIDQAKAALDRYERNLERTGESAPGVRRIEDAIDRLRNQIDDLTDEAHRLLELQIAPEAEYESRGRWSRAFLVTGGHLHSSMGCSTCNRDGKRTRFTWMTQLSGASEDEIVEAAGDRACTTCYPSAPMDVLSRPSALRTREEEEAAAQRAERDEERARKAAEREAKGITTPDGEPLRSPGRYGRVIATLRAAEIELTDTILRYEVREWYRQDQEALDEGLLWRDQLVDAIAAKKGIPAVDVLSEAKEKAAKKAKREGW